ESPELCDTVRAAGYKVIKAFPVDTNFDFARTSAYKGSADYVLFDTKGPLHGGNAMRFDWSLLQQYDQSVPFFLSAGLSAHKLSGIANLERMIIHALDGNSGLDSAPGMKDLKRLKHFMVAAAPALKCRLKEIV